jgi:cytochrome c553
MREAFRDSEHLIRLALLFLAGVVLFLIARAILVPAGFGELGHYRTGALEDNRGRALAFAGHAACADCHDEVAKALGGGRHARVACESCHGPLAAHAADPEATKPARLEVVALCARCHEQNRARPATQPQVDVAEHAEGAACTECHAAHAPHLE